MLTFVITKPHLEPKRLPLHLSDRIWYFFFLISCILGLPSWKRAFPIRTIKGDNTYYYIEIHVGQRPSEDDKRSGVGRGRVEEVSFAASGSPASGYHMCQRCLLQPLGQR